MQEYIPLFVLAFIWIIFATVQDIKTREVANWLNFSLIALALAYRAFYATSANSISFFVFGVIGLFVTIALGYTFYYMKAFAGGDAKLLMGLGLILPYQTYLHTIILPIFLVFVLFLSGALYSLIYSIFLVSKNKKKFSEEFKKTPKSKKQLTTISTILSAIFLIAAFYKIFLFLPAIIFLIPLAWRYTKALDKCMIVLTPPEKLTEGDWLEKEVIISTQSKVGRVAGALAGGKTKRIKSDCVQQITIKKSVHGLSFKDIQLLRKHKKKVLIKQGIPFVPAFLITIILMALFFSISKQVLPFSLFG